MRNPVQSGPQADALPPVAIFDDNWATTLTFAVSLGRRGVPLHFYGPGAGRFSRYCHKHHRCPPIDDVEQFVPWLRDEIRSGRISRVAPTTDLIAYYTALLRDEFPLQVQRSIAPMEEIQNCLIKTNFTELCANIGQPTPATFAPDDAKIVADVAQGLTYPLILKPKSHLVVGWTERGRLIRDAQQLTAQYSAYPVQRGHEPLADRFPELRWPLLQQYVPSASRQVYSVTGIKDADRGIIVASLV